MTEGSVTFVDRLTFQAVCALISLPKGSRVEIFEGEGPWQLFWKGLLRTKGLKCSVSQFFVGHLKTKAGESLYLAARRAANLNAEKVAALIVSKEISGSGIFENVPSEYLLRHIARRLVHQLERFLLMMEVAKQRSDICNAVYLHDRFVFELNDVAHLVDGVHLQQISTSASTLLATCTEISKELLIAGYYFLFRFLMQVFPKISLDRLGSIPSVLMTHDDTLRLGNDYRTQLFWVKESDLGTKYTLNILSSRHSDAGIDTSVIPYLGSTIFLRSLSKVLGVDRNSYRHKVPAVFRKHWRFSLCRSILLTDHSQRSFFLILARYFRSAQVFASFCIDQNVKVFVSSENYSLQSDAIHLVCKALRLEAVSWQYSHLQYFNVVLAPISGSYVLFSTQYRKVLESPLGRAVKYMEGAPLLVKPSMALLQRADNLKATLRKRGATTIVCYFDESIQNDRWGLVHPKDHERELQILASLVAENPNFAVVIKPQFVRNSPTQLYGSQSWFKDALETGRFMELMKGEHRNDVLTIEAALVSDLVISHKFGGTAALESAAVGTRAVLVDAYGSTSIFDAPYSKGQIVHPSVESVLNSLKGTDQGHSTLGEVDDWSCVLGNLAKRKVPCNSSLIHDLVTKAILGSAD